MIPTPLAGLKVVDLTRVLAGPLCTQYMGLMGAEIIKVETLNGGDEMRKWPPFETTEDGDNRTGTPYLAVNHAKHSIAVDLKAPEGRAIILDLIKDADVVIESFAGGVAERLGLGPEDARKINPKVIYCRISGWGSTGPLKDLKGYDAVLQSFTGMLAITGDRDGGPTRVPFSPIDQTTGLNALIGILAALNERTVTGTARTVEVCLFDSAAGLLGYMVQNLWTRGTEPQRFAIAHESLCPYEAFETTDRPLLLGIANDTMWAAFCNVIGQPELAKDPRFATNALRVENRAATLAIVKVEMAKRSADDWFDVLKSLGIPCSPINNLTEFSSHPHTLASGMVFDYDHPLFGAMKGMAQPIKFDGMRARSEQTPPALGEHTHDVLQRLGYDSAKIAALEANGVVKAFARTALHKTA